VALIECECSEFRFIGDCPVQRWPHTHPTHLYPPLARVHLWLTA
jgi:hypothetical protein